VFVRLSDPLFPHRVPGTGQTALALRIDLEEQIEIGLATPTRRRFVPGLTAGAENAHRDKISQSRPARTELFSKLYSEFVAL
jgi:hypothetical protein